MRVSRFSIVRGPGHEDNGVYMKIKYFKDTDTALLEFSGAQVAETREVSENIYLDLDSEGNLVSMTVEHAAQNASLPEVAVEEVASV